MGTFDFLRKKDKDIVVKSVPTHDTSLTLTTVGRTKAEQMALKSPYFEVLSALLEADGTTTKIHLAESIGWPVTKVDAVAKSLIGAGYIKQVKV